MIHTQAARRWHMEQRKKWIRRQYYHFLDIAGGIAWGLAFIIGFACLIFILGHR